MQAKEKITEKPKIKIKEANKGKFTEYCKRKGYEGVTSKCEEEGLASRPNLVKTLKSGMIKILLSNNTVQSLNKNS